MKLAILGASGHGKVVADTAEYCGWQSIQFFDDAWPGLRTNGVWPVVGDTAVLMKQVAKFDGVLVAIGDNRVRYCKLCELLSVGAPVVTLIHPAANVSRYSSVGVGTVVFAGAVVNVNTNIGLGCIINTGCSVDHDCILGGAVHISPGARLAGGVVVGELSWVGIGASVRQLVCVGKGVTIGAGSAVLDDIPNDLTVVGVPAKKIR
ncbi:acetyltransferase [Microbulbifer sp. 2304DJ12-6]|uniref:acetyltransferase n=1 Tax=Microbulbifer sp. 2304DJ12-6 TaxID=3233340 RepID=UPI0039AF787F